MPLRIGRLVPVALAGVLAVGIGVARADEAAVTSLEQATQRGAEIFAHESFGGSGSCEACHLSGGRTEGKTPSGRTIPSLVGAAGTFPRFSQRSHSVVTLPQQMARCIGGALKGKAPDFDDPEMVYLETYIASLSKGTVMGAQFK